MQFIRDHIDKSSMTVSKDSETGKQLVDSINKLKLEFIRLKNPQNVKLQN